MTPLAPSSVVIRLMITSGRRCHQSLKVSCVSCAWKARSPRGRRVEERPAAVGLVAHSAPGTVGRSLRRHEAFRLIDRTVVVLVRLRLIEGVAAAVDVHVREDPRHRGLQLGRTRQLALTTPQHPRKISFTAL